MGWVYRIGLPYCYNNVKRLEVKRAVFFGSEKHTGGCGRESDWGLRLGAA